MFQYRIYPTKKQETLLNETLNECRWLYNHLLEKRKEAYEQEGKSLSCYGQQATYPMLKQERSSLNVGIDVGLKTFASLSTGEEIANPRFFRKEEKALAKVQRKHSKLAKGTPERKKHRKVIARVHERIHFRRDNFTHQESRSIVDRFGVICVEDLTVNRMMHNHCLTKSIADASWSAFFSQLAAKAEEAGRTLVKVNPAYTSQTCSVCGHRQKMPLDVRIFDCPCCHVQLDRDLNAAKNICGLGLQALGLSVEAPGFSRGE